MKTIQLLVLALPKKIEAQDLEDKANSILARVLVKGTPLVLKGQTPIRIQQEQRNTEHYLLIAYFNHPEMMSKLIFYDELGVTRVEYVNRTWISKLLFKLGVDFRLGTAKVRQFDE